MIKQKIKELKARYEQIKYPLSTPGTVEIESQLKVLREMDRKIEKAAKERGNK